MKGYFVKVGDKEIGPFRSANAAKAEKQELIKDGHSVTVVSRNVPESVWIEHLGDAEQELEDDDEDIDWDSIFSDDDDDEIDDEDEDSDDDEEDDDEEDDDEEDDEDEDEDEDEPGGKHFFFRDLAGKK